MLLFGGLMGHLYLLSWAKILISFLFVKGLFFSKT